MQGQFIIYIIMCGRESEVGRGNVENKLNAKNNDEKMNKRRREKREINKSNNSRCRVI